jgi:hypothetical protein
MQSLAKIAQSVNRAENQVFTIDPASAYVEGHSWLTDSNYDLASISSKAFGKYK